MPEIIVKLGETTVQRYHFDRDAISIGRARDNDIVVENLSVSRNHARIRHQDGKYILTDLNSANGSFVNGQRVTKAELEEHDIISIGKHKLHFLVDASQIENPAEEVSASDPVDISPQTANIDPAHFGGVLIVTRGKQAQQVFPLGSSQTTIGRANDNDIRLHDWFVSKNHAVILREGPSFTLRDLGSWRGTTVNGETVKEKPLKQGDELVFGTTVMTLKTGAVEELVDSAPGSSDDIVKQARASLDELEAVQPDADGLQRESAEDIDSVRLSVADMEAADDAPIAEPATGEDEFEPLTEQELAELEAEVDDEFAGHDDDEFRARAEFEQLEAEKMLSEGGGWSSKPGAMIDAEALDKQDKQGVDPPDNMAILEQQIENEEVQDEEVEDAEEEASLFDGSVSDKEPGSEKAPEDQPGTAPPPEPVAEQPRPSADDGHATLDVIPVPSDVSGLPLRDGVDPKDARRWLRGMRNRSKIVRREAARKLKELTGQDYDWESDPE